MLSVAALLRLSRTALISWNVNGIAKVCLQFPNITAPFNQQTGKNQNLQFKILTAIKLAAFEAPS